MAVAKECPPTSPPAISAEKPRRSSWTLIALVALHRLRRLLPGEVRLVRARTKQTPNLKLRLSERSSQAMLLGSTWQSLAELHGVRSKAIVKALENFEEACDSDEDTPLKFRPLMAEFMVRRSLYNSKECEYALTESIPMMTVLLPGIPSRPSGAVMLSFQSRPAASLADRPIPQNFESRALAY
jgi:hypothetical protein